MNPDIESLPLKDIHLPDPVGWWPLAPGWWILLGVIILLAVLYFFIQRLRDKRRLAKVAMSQFDQLVANYQQHGDSQAFLNELSVLLRRLSISAFPVNDVAGLTGESWLGFLDATRQSKTGTVNFNSSIGQLLVNAPYQRSANISRNEIDKLITTAKAWIRGLKTSNDKPLPAGGH